MSGPRSDRTPTFKDCSPEAYQDLIERGVDVNAAIHARLDAWIERDRREFDAEIAESAEPEPGERTAGGDAWR